MKHKPKVPKKNWLDAGNSARLRKVPNIEEGTAQVAHPRSGVVDDYVDWLLSQRGTVASDADLEF